MENKEVIFELIDKLKDLDYFIFGGFAIHHYTEGKRSFQDIDMLMRHEDLKKFAKRVGGNIEKRKITKGDFTTEDYFLEMNFKGQEIEAISISPGKKDEEKSFEKQFLNRKKKDFFGKEVFLVPKEGTLVHKAIVNREKDVRDLKMLRGKVDLKLLKEIADLRGERDKVFGILNDLGYDLNN